MPRIREIHPSPQPVTVRVAIACIDGSTGTNCIPVVHSYSASVADPDPGSGIGYLFDPWIRDPGWEKVSIRILLKFLDEDPGSGMETVRIRDPGWKKVGSGIRDKYPGSATLPIPLLHIYPHHT
jgi:hypothetical protein